MKKYDGETMKGINEEHQNFINEAIKNGLELFLDKGIKGWDEDGNEINVSARLTTEYGLFVANVETTLSEEEEFINYR